MPIAFPPLRRKLRPALAACAIAVPWLVQSSVFAGKPVAEQASEASNIDYAAAHPGLSLLAQNDPSPPPGAIADLEPAAADAAEPPALTTEPALFPEAKPSASESLAINLIKKLVDRGVLPKEDADELIQEAEAETAAARNEMAQQQQAMVSAAVAQAVATVQAQGGSNAPDPLFDSEDALRVTYIPETVKAQLRDELRAEVMSQAKEERWADPRLVPDWVTRIRLFGDVRVRGEGDFFPDGNDNTGAFPNFNAINTGAPFDLAGVNFPPNLNVDQDRYRLRLRVRLGLDANLGGGFTAGLRIATGENSSPTSTNQSLGAQGGNFSKYAIWLDRGFLKWETGDDPDRKFAASIGRFENPFFSTEIAWDDDVGFDGGAIQARYEVAKGFVPYLAAGIFPVFNTDFNFSSNQPAKFESTDKWLYGAQLGADWKIQKDFNFKFGVSYLYFDNVEGQLSDPFLPLSASDQGNTDNTRPSFAQKGNTYRPLRRIISSPLNNFGTSSQFQYFGLATPFHDLVLTGRLDYTRWEPFQVSLTGEWIKNVAFDEQDIDLIAINNRGADSSTGSIGRFSGGDIAWMVNLRAGSAALARPGDWQVGVNYRYVESDAVVDAFTDSDFGLGGTNLKGYTIYGGIAVSPRVSVGLRYMTSDEVAGPPLSVDVIQLDVAGKF